MLTLLALCLQAEVIEPRTVPWEEMAREVFDPLWILPADLPLAEGHDGIAWRLEDELPERVGLVVEPDPSHPGAPRCFGDLVALARADPGAIDALLERVRREQPELWSGVGEFAEELLRAERLDSSLWEPDEDSGADGMLFARPLTLVGQTIEPWSVQSGSRLVQQAAALVHADLEAIKASENDYSAYWDRPGTSYEEIHAVDRSHVRGLDARERPFAALTLFFESDLPFPFGAYECDLRILNRVRGDGRAVCDIFSPSRDFHWLAGRDLFVPVRASDGTWQGTLIVRSFGFDLRSVPDGDDDRRTGLRTSLGSLKRESEELYRRYGGAPRTLDGSVPPFTVRNGD